MGPTGGYLVGFCVAAYVCGWLAERGLGTTVLRAGFVNLVGTLIILACGGAWLTHLIGAGKAYALGISPFLLSSLVKIAFGGVLVVLINRTPLGRVGPNR
jgi:biotin transport system substrate-specific component